MAKPLTTAKQAVDLAGGPVRVSKIRRDPPPKVKEVTIQDRDERDQRIVAIGVAAFTVAILVIIIGLASYNGWSPSEVVVHM